MAESPKGRRQVLLEALMAEYGEDEETWTAMGSLDRVLEAVRKAVLKEPLSHQVLPDDPEMGHTFRFRFDIRGSSKVVGEPVHTDAPDFMGPTHEITVRGWSLTEALHRARFLPFEVLMGTVVSDEAMPENTYDPHAYDPHAEV